MIDTIVDGVGNMSIGKGKAVLSGHGIAGAFMVNNIQSGDTLKVILNLSPAFPKLEQLVGGNTWLIKNGVVVGSDGDRHPRTMIGFNQDTSKIYFFTLDGRQPGYSVGMSYKELGEYMLEWGVYQGLNLDGGGSTTMVVRGSVVNSPSDIGGERSVSNSLLLVSTAPTGPLANIRISPREVYVMGGSDIQFTAKGFDEYYNPVQIQSGTLIWSCDSSIGSITQNGLFTGKSDTLSGFIYAEIGNIKDSALVRLTKLTSIILEPNPVILKVGQSQTMTASAYDSYGNLIQLNHSAYQWNVSGGVGTISSSGVFTASIVGEGEIIAEYDSIQGTASVSIGVSAAVVIDDFTGLSNFSLSGVRVNLSQCSFELDDTTFVSNPASGRLNYSLTTGGTSALYLNCSIQISGTPEKVSLNIYGDGKAHWLRGEFADADNEKFILNFTDADPGIDWINTWKYIEVNLSTAVPSWSNPSAVLTYPITWTRIYLAETSDDKKDDGSICFDDFTAHFIATGVEEDKSGIVPNDYKLFQNYPNPFNPATNIKFDIPERNHVKIKIFDILGREIGTLISEERGAGSYEINFDGSDLSSGIYFYNLQAGEYSQTKKMILLR